MASAKAQKHAQEAFEALQLMLNSKKEEQEEKAQENEKKDKEIPEPVKKKQRRRCRENGCEKSTEKRDETKLQRQRPEFSQQRCEHHGNVLSLPGYSSRKI